MKKLIFLILFIVVLVLLGVGIFYHEKSSEDFQSNNNLNDISVMEFPSLKLCKETRGEWKVVSSDEFPANPEQGVYSPTINPEINYKCFCPEGKKWDAEEGCIE